MLEAFACLAVTSIAQWEKSPADRMLAQRSETFCRKMKQYAKKCPIGWPRYLLLKGQLNAAAGKSRAAMGLFKRSLQRAERFALPLEIGLAQYHLGSVSQGNDRWGYLTAAVATLERLRVAHELRLAREALARAGH